jgi:hypothetical protein
MSDAGRELDERFSCPSFSWFDSCFHDFVGLTYKFTHEENGATKSGRGGDPEVLTFDLHQLAAEIVAGEQANKSGWKFLEPFIDIFTVTPIASVVVF